MAIFLKTFCLGTQPKDNARWDGSLGSNCTWSSMIRQKYLILWLPREISITGNPLNRSHSMNGSLANSLAIKDISAKHYLNSFSSMEYTWIPKYAKTWKTAWCIFMTKFYSRKELWLRRLMMNWKIFVRSNIPGIAASKISSPICFQGLLPFLFFQRSLVWILKLLKGLHYWLTHRSNSR